MRWGFFVCLRVCKRYFEVRIHEIFDCLMPERRVLNIVTTKMAVPLIEMRRNAGASFES